MLLYLLIFRPFEGRLNNVLYIFNEFIVLISFADILVLNSFPFSAGQVEAGGIVIICFVFVSLFFTWCLFLPGFVSGILTAVLDAVKKKPEEGKEEKLGTASEIKKNISLPDNGQDDFGAKNKDQARAFSTVNKKNKSIVFEDSRKKIGNPKLLRTDYKTMERSNLVVIRERKRSLSPSKDDADINKMIFEALAVGGKRVPSKHKPENS
eukprot:TRINITY_DN4930_c0_g1_i15.p1 TRINITY_DN4930_c0_g1~~TRINITY_DN4930_c0_g1_i15.p1  ORF type:complete len:209 (-),score=79.51 TRINITY_DN4930_c0_g1_i15:158-784(-)